MSKSNSFETAFLQHIFNNVAIANVGDASGLPASATAGNLYVRLYTNAVAVDDATIGTECAYTGYVTGGVAVPRTAGGWTVSGNNASNTAIIPFGACTAGSETISYFGIWKDNTNTTDAYRLFHGTVTTPLAVSVGITPEIAIGVLDINED